MGIGENEKQVREMSKQQKSRGTIAQSKNFTNGCIYKRCRKRFAKLQKKKNKIYMCVDVSSLCVVAGNNSQSATHANYARRRN